MAGTLGCVSEVEESDLDMQSRSKARETALGCSGAETQYGFAGNEAGLRQCLRWWTTDRHSGF